MKVVVYIDIYFLVNLSMDYTLLYVVGRLNNQSKYHLRRLLASCFGALSVCSLLLLPVEYKFLHFIVSYVFICNGMLWIAFPFVSWREHIMNVCSLYFITVLLGGIANVIIIQMRQNSGILSGQMGGEKEVTMIQIGMYIVIIYILLPSIMKYFKEYFLRRDCIYDVELQLEERKVSCQALLDTGNYLKDPMTNKPVIICESKVLSTLLKKSLLEYTTRFRVIPFHSIGKREGVLYAITIDSIMVKGNRNILYEKPVIASYEGELAANHEYRAILHKEVLKSSC